MIRRLAAADAAALVDELSELLRDAVFDGASIGFVLPLEPGEIETYWQTVLAALRDGSRSCSPRSRGRR